MNGEEVSNENDSGAYITTENKTNLDIQFKLFLFFVKVHIRTN
jgi:hypothetical protein